MTLTTEVRTKNDEIYYLKKEIEDKDFEQNQLNSSIIIKNTEEVQHLKD